MGLGYVNRYSEAFKIKILEDLEKRGLTQAEVQRKYGVSLATIQRWIRRYGKKYLLTRIVRIEMPTEKSPNEIIKELKREKQQLESALAQSQLKIMCMEALVEAAEQRLNIDIKKKIGPELPATLREKLKNRGKK